MNEQFIMNPGDAFVAAECGCAFTVTSGPNDLSMVRRAPECCCGHAMVKQKQETDASESAVDPVGA